MVLTERVYYKTARPGCCGSVKFIHERELVHTTTAAIRQNMIQIIEETVSGEDDAWKYQVIDESKKRIFEIYYMEDEDVWVYRDEENAKVEKDYKAIFNSF